MPPKAKDAKKSLYKQGTALKDIIPPTVKQPPREGRPVRIPEYAPTSVTINPYEPQPEFEDWPGDEAAMNFDFGLESQAGKQYVDPVKFAVPSSFKSKENQIIFWRRPKEMLKNETADPPLSISSMVTDNPFQRKKTATEEEFSEGRLSIFQDGSGVGPFDKEDVDISVFQTYEREETPEEVELRIKDLLEKQQQQQQKKKPVKKEEPIDTNPLKIKDVKLSSISVREDIPAYSKWIASQLQVIKDRNIRDVNTKKPIWSKVYPQKDGAPVFNPSGRYWVKLYYMGKEKKIDIDDRIPVIYNKSLFPRSVNDNEIWPYIFTKALIKLNSSRWNDENAKELEVGDGSIIYALTGYIPETISLPLASQEKWKTIADALSDKKFTSGEKFVTCFCLPSHKPSAPSNKIQTKGGIDKDNPFPEQRAPVLARSGTSKSPRNQSEQQRPNTLTRTFTESVDQKSPQSVGPPKRKEHHSMTTIIKSRPEPVITKKEENFREKPTNIVPGFAYSVVDLFENENFNMVYILKMTDNDMKLRTEFMNLKKVNVNKMKKDQILEHRRQKKELKDKIAEEDKKKLEMIKKPAIQYRLLKIRSSVGKAQGLQFVCPFDEDDISLAKKCIINKLSKPPNYEQYEVKLDDKSVSSAQVAIMTAETPKLLPLDDFSKLDNVKEPLKRGPGAWLESLDFEGCFQYIQIFHDPTKFKYRENSLLPARQDEELVNFDDKEVIVVEGEPEEEEKDRDNSIPFHSFLYSFTSSRAANMTIEPKPSFTLQRYDFRNFEVAYTYKTLNQPHDSDCLALENKNQIFRIQILSPLTCYFWISSTLRFKLMSLNEFLCSYESYQVKTQQIEYPIIEKNRYHLFYKGIINAMNQRETIICKIKSATDLVMLRSLRLKIVEVTNKTYKSDEEFKSGVVTYPLEQTYYTVKSTPISLEAQKRYLIVIEGRMAETTNEGVLDFDILFRAPDFSLEPVEQVEPLEYMDKYLPTKHGILFRERLFLNTEAQSSFFVRISELLPIGGAAQQQPQKGKKVEAPQFEEKDVTDSRTIKLELFRDNDLIAFALGQNKVALTNVGLYPTNNKDEPRNYFLQASFDLREWPEGREENEQTNNLHWILKVCSNDTIGIVKDTQKEDNIKAIKKSWEDKEPGRAEKAKTARKKFMILEKMKKGQPLEQDELQLINEPRQKKNKEEEVAKKDPKAKQPPPKGKAPPAKGQQKKEEAPVEEKKEDRPLPKSKDSVMREITKFLSHMEQPRVLEEGAEDHEYGVRTEEEQNELREKILLGREEAYGMYDRNKLAKAKIKEILTSKKDKILGEYRGLRETTKEKLVALLKEREEFRKKDKEAKDKERAIIALCKQEKPNYEEVVKCLTENEATMDADLLKILKKVKKNAYIGEKIDRVNNSMAAFDIPALTAVLDEIRNEEIEIDAELYEKAEELLDTAEKNPNFIAEKQKEAQKAAKGKKK